MPVRLHLPCMERMEDRGSFSLGEEAGLGGEEGPGGPVTPGRPPRRWRQTLHTGAWWEDKRQKAEMEKREIQTGHKGKHFHSCPKRL